MARMTITSVGESVDVGGEVDVIGTRAGDETVIVTRGDISFDASFGAGGDTIILPGSADDYTVRLFGSIALFESASVTVAIPLGVAGSFIEFDDAAFLLRINTSTGSAVIGQQTITSTAETVQGEPPVSVLNLDSDTVIGPGSTVIEDVDTIVLGSGRGEAGETGHTYVIALENDNAPPGGGILTIDGSALAADTDGGGSFAEEWLALDGSAVTSYRLAITGGAGVDVILGGARADQISGGAGGDYIRGNEGADVLTGGSGIDSFWYSDGTDSSSSSGRDTITDFTSGTDFLIAASFELFLFTGTASNIGTATDFLTEGDGWIDVVFQQDQHLLWADMNDDGELSAGDVSIYLPTVTTITNDDTWVVSPFGTTVVTESYSFNDTIEDAVVVDTTAFISFGTDPNLTEPDAPSVELRGQIDDNNDVDVYEIYLEAGETVILDVDGAYDTSDPSDLDSVIGIYDAAGNLLASNDDAETVDEGSSSTFDSFLEFEVDESGYYYVAIISFENGSPGGSPEDYHLLLSILPDGNAAQAAMSFAAEGAITAFGAELLQPQAFTMA